MLLTGPKRITAPFWMEFGGLGVGLGGRYWGRRGRSGEVGLARPGVPLTGSGNILVPGRGRTGIGASEGASDRRGC